MEKNDRFDMSPVYEKALKAGKRTYFFDVRETRSGDYYLTITESKKKPREDGTFYYDKHKIYLYKEDFEGFKEHFEEVTDYILDKKGKEVISEKHDPNFKGRWNFDFDRDKKTFRDEDEISDIKFEDID